VTEKRRQRYANKSEQEKAVMLEKQRIYQVVYHSKQLINKQKEIINVGKLKYNSIR
jgi:hypothetical protein